MTRYEITDVKALRENLEITQAQLAQSLVTSVDTINSWAYISGYIACAVA